MLRTNRLRLRAPSLDDFDSSLAMWSDPAVTRFIGGRPQTGEEVWARLLRYLGHWHLLGCGYWAIEDAEGRWLGEAGLADYRRDTVPPIGPAPEIGWVLAPHAHGRGYAREAAAAILAWRDRALPPGPTICIIHPDHAASHRIAARLGFNVVGPVAYHGHHTTLRRRPALLLRSLVVADAAQAAVLIRTAFAAQPVQTDPPSSALRETEATIAGAIASGGGAAIDAEGTMLGAVLWREDEGGLYFGRLAVHPDWRGQGLARRLIEAAEREAEGRGIARIYLSTRLALTENRRLFGACGFREVGTSAHPGYAEPTMVTMEKKGLLF